MKLVKKLLIGVAVLVVLLVVAGFAALYYINDLVKLGVEKGGTVALGTKTTLNSADIGVFSGKAALNGLAVANPQGFKAPEFMNLGRGAVEVSLGSLRQDVVEIPRFELDTIRVALERKDGKTNYKVILDNLAKLPSGSSPKGGSDTPGKKFIVKDLTINDVKVTVDLLDGALPVGALVVPIDQIHLTDIGSASNGLPMADIAGVIVRAILATASANGQGIIPADILGDLQGQLSALGDLSQLGVKLDAKVGEELKKATDKAKEELQKGLDGVKDKIQDKLPGGAADKLKGLLGGDKDKK